ncbi:MAG: chitobiase/beta-hexosaminidase C-terminal domain-containing protein [Aeromonadaceae bacterium]
MNRRIVATGLLCLASQAVAYPGPATVTASVPQGTYDKAIKVKLSVDVDQQSSKIYFTRDGSAPTTSSPLYKKGQTFTIVDQGKNRDFWLRTLLITTDGQQRLQSFSYYIHSAPEVTPSLQPGTYDHNVALTLSAKDNTDPAATIYYTLDGSLPTTKSSRYTAGTTIPLAIKSGARKTFRLRTMVMDGEKNWQRQLFDYRIDTRRGCTNGSAAEAQSACRPLPLRVYVSDTQTDDYYNYFTGLTLTLHAEGTDLSQACYSVDGSDPSACLHTYTDGTKLMIGKHTTSPQVLRLYASSQKQGTQQTREYHFTPLIIEPPLNRFNWNNATIYSLITDRFRNGDANNDHSYGRECQQGAYNSTKQQLNATRCADGYETQKGTFHGGDLQGLLDKLNEGYFQELGINVLELSPPFEQIHGFTGGENFKSYPYQGYSTLDFTQVDANYGDDALLKQVIDAAHSQGIRVIFDIAINQLGAPDMQTAHEYGFAGLAADWESYYFTNDPTTIHYKTYSNYLNYKDSHWRKWWGNDWVRANAYGTCTGTSELMRCFDELPDLKTESTASVELPLLLQTKWRREGRLATQTASLDTFFQQSGLPRTPANHVIKWLTDWVRHYGVDGFHCQTPTHVDMSVWKELKKQSEIALKEWQSRADVIKPVDLQELNFWMAADAWGTAALRNTYKENGFDAIDNFSFLSEVQSYVAGNTISASADALFSKYANLQGNSNIMQINGLSHADLTIFDRNHLKNGATLLMMLPGETRILFGDESARPSDSNAPHWYEAHQGTMNWCDGTSGSEVSPCMDQSLLQHWQKLGQFRSRHPAIGRGSHSKLADSPYTFSRLGSGDNVVVAMATEGTQSIQVGNIFPEGAQVRDYYSGQTATVNDHTVTLDAKGVVLLERAY